MRPMREKMHTGELYLPNDDEIWWRSEGKALWTLMCIWESGKNEMTRNAERDVCGGW